jgi:lamin tail-like protein
MRSDVILFGSILIFIFVIWIYTGGPQHPISFAGPYLTPITDVDDESEAYGPTDSGSLWSSWGDDDTSSTVQDIPDAGRSPFAGDVTISGGDLNTDSARSEYLVLNSNTDSDVTITGWRLVSSKDGTEVRIPDGTYERNSRSRTIELSGGDELVITSGSRSRADIETGNDNTWYVYLGRSRDLWPDSDTTITLLDGNGKMVDQYQY